MIRFRGLAPLVAPALAAALLVSLATPARAGDALGAESPQALAKRFAGAASTHDLAEVARCLAPEPRTELTAGFFASAMMMVAFSQMGAEMGSAMAGAFGEEMTDEQKAEAEAELEAARARGKEVEGRLTALLEKHGIEVPDTEEAMAADDSSIEEDLADVDQPALLTDLVAFMDQLSEEGEMTSTREETVIPDELADLAIDGDRATAKLGDRDVEMVRIDGRWYFASMGILEGEAPAMDEG